MTVVPWRNYPKRLPLLKRFTPLCRMRNTFNTGYGLIRVGGRKDFAMAKSHWFKKWREVKRRRMKRTNWLALADARRRSRKRDADRKAGRLPPLPRIEVMWDTAFVIRMLERDPAPGALTDET